MSNNLLQDYNRAAGAADVMARGLAKLDYQSFIKDAECIECYQPPRSHAGDCEIGKAIKAAKEWRHEDYGKTWFYMGCKIVPISNKPIDFGDGVYRSHYWRVEFPDRTWIHIRNKEECRGYIEKYLQKMT